MHRLLCRLLGHAWRPVWRPGRGDRGTPCLVCIRCRENGWLVR